MKNFFIFTIFLCLFFLNLQGADGKIVWSEQFKKDGNLADNGYKLLRSNKKDIFEIQNGILNITCFNSPYKGTYWKKDAKIVPAGEFSFELRTCIGGSTNGDNLSLKFHYGQHVFAFRFPKCEVYSINQKKWYSAGIVRDDKWHKYKVRFNAKKKTAEYFIDDMTNPVFIYEDFVYSPKVLPYFGIENYGLSAGTIRYELRNLKVVELDENAVSGAKVKLGGTALFKGVSANEWPLDALVKKLGEKKLQVYIMDAVGSHVDNGANQLELMPKPAMSPAVLPKNIILADISLDVLPPYVHKQILKVVENGGRLIILRGYFTLNKGNYAGSILEKILPVSVKDKWSDPKVLAGSQVIRKNNKNVMAIKKYGKGSVIVALEMPHLQKVGSCLLEFDYGMEG